MHRIIINKELCTGCKSCVLACMLKHSENSNMYTLNLNDIDNDSRGHIELDKDNKPVPIICRHCDEPECVLTCMSGAMVKDEKTGIVSYDEKKCGSCYMCIMSCPYGGLKVDDKTKQVVLKCDLCINEENPKCVANCPTGALELQKGESLC
ncbi:4Fe-4S dicluster domain-containing protein [Romboutsia sp. 1001216sp1]|uniref:4Fe-4S dicluster domain-containing protein n=1 Tax=Romboutsia sp. 1001216sp1 TaxID=2986997 RepID=UPI00232BFF50|nr:4Fe-4S dicluster domain-containing protein [Romboutsia sp. 1001216sp1]MDB8805892.1 4Fe-4S dicluster domain-containing protein [Romboutsia sp. 1001216sp1]MDB8808343.1 4Fe-4S dicluster domain-containing protein [Romboutsia sp. 1001216sp1]MDB8811645.1 4Fe-4S dicluster domain-containing protein [Romboutsia sp. 1001216sp1]MDB8817332.1 4Fe-4S dicluster domain-containing protein [Romboutsia sp. 1001216sp1]MDB8819931.1 4Fe-4S dicluster domain-containing protein [Romboutsia sp. 1001216sp1]